MLGFDVSIQIFGSGGQKRLTWGGSGELSEICTVGGCRDLLRKVWQESGLIA